MLTDRSISQRWWDVAWVLALAGAATAMLMTLYTRPLLLLSLLLLLNGVALIRWHSKEDLAHMLVGALFGNATELACDTAGVWVHANRDFLGVAPYYIFACYPVLALAFARLVGAAAGCSVPDGESRRRFAQAFVVLLGLVAFSCRYGRSNGAESVVVVVFLLVSLFLFRTPRDRAAMAIGAFLGLVWELPCTASGVWHFPHPQIAALIPAWLPLAYAGFHVTLLRLGDAWALANAPERAVEQPVPLPVQS